MAVLNPYQQYAQNQVNTATQEELPLLLYKGAVKFILLAMQAIDRQDMQDANNNIIKAQNIYRELSRTLDDNYAVSSDLGRLYEFMINHLIQANIKKDKAVLEDALGLAKEFVTTWEQAILIYRQTKAAAARAGK